MQFRDYLALAGDAVDNVPGAKGIGPKTATQLIQQYGDIDSIMAHAHEHSLPVRIPQPELQIISVTLGCAAQPWVPYFMLSLPEL